MRFTAMAVISIGSLIVGTAIAIGGAAIGYGYWTGGEKRRLKRDDKSSDKIPDGWHLEPDSKVYGLASRLTASWMQARVMKAARVSARFS